MNFVCIGEHFGNSVRDVTFETLNFAGLLKEKYGGKVDLIIAGKIENDEIFKKYEIDNVWIIEDPLDIYDPEAYTNSIIKILNNIDYSVIISPHTSIGMDLSPRIASSLKIPIVTTCESIEIMDSGISFTRVIYGGKAKEKILIEGKKAFVTIRPGDFETAKEKPGNPNITRVEIVQSENKIKPIKIERLVQEDVDITKFNAIVAVGRGIGTKENLALAEELAKSMNGVVACSRPISDLGWLPKTRQVGTSGKTVKPKLYIALGISGATNHINGMKKSNIIIAVNKDPSAPIFEVSHLGVVGDINDILPLLVDELKG